MSEARRGKKGQSRSREGEEGRKGFRGEVGGEVEERGVPHRGSLAGGPSLSPDELVWPTVHFPTMGKGEFSPAPIVPAILPESYRRLG